MDSTTSKFNYSSGQYSPISAAGSHSLLYCSDILGTSNSQQEEKTHKSDQSTNVDGNRTMASQPPPEYYSSTSEVDGASSQSSDNEEGNELSSTLPRELATGSAKECPNYFRWLSDVYTGITMDDARTLVEKLHERRQSEYSLPRAIAVVYHPEKSEVGQEKGHLHLYHACRFTRSTCHCTEINQALHTLPVTGDQRSRRHGLKRRVRCRIVYCEALNEEYWTRWLFYFNVPPRECVYLEIGQVSFLEKIHRLKGIRQYQRTQESTGLSCTMEMCELSSEDDARQSSHSGPDETSTQRNQRTTRSASGERQSVSRSKRIRIGPSQYKVNNHAAMMAKILELLVTPLANSCEHYKWLDDPILSFYDKSDLDYRRAISVVQRKIALYSFREIIELSSKSPDGPIYFARDNNHYMSYGDSLAAVKELLFHQYKDEKNVIAFLKRLCAVCEKQIPKKNSMYITGPPNAGKTWFFDMVTAFYLNVGHVANMVRGDHFPLNDCINRRLLMWNEPSIMMSAYDTVKMIAGGDPCPANVKYQGHSVINRTPLILTANRCVFQKNDPVWNSRMFFEQWTTAQLLKTYTKYPHPRAYGLLMVEYGII